MKVKFSKYQGAGNDFIMIDNTHYHLDFQGKHKVVRRLCDRHFGVGADGLILMEEEGDSLVMRYFNADGKPGSMCGNGARCFTRFARAQGHTERQLHFKTVDGDHEATELDGGWISLDMHDIPVSEIDRDGEAYVLDTGSPHYIRFVRDLSKVDMFEEGREIRNRPEYIDEGINVSFVTEVPGGIRMKTFERGVEDVTLSCGTGVTAAALCYGIEENFVDAEVKVQTDGGDLAVRFRRIRDIFTDIRLEGPAEFVFSGEIEIEI